MDVSGSESCPVDDFGTDSVESLSSVTTVLVQYDNAIMTGINLCCFGFYEHITGDAILMLKFQNKLGWKACQYT